MTPIHPRYGQHCFEQHSALAKGLDIKDDGQVFWLYRCSRCGVDVGGFTLQGALETATRLEMYALITCSDGAIAYLHQK